MNPEGFFVLGATHHTAPLEARERLSLDSSAASALTAQVSTLPGLREIALLATCNRLEFYVVADDRAAAARVQAALCANRNFDSSEFERLRLHLRGPDAVRHLLEVAAGVDSQMVGETEILGQVKEAYASAQMAGHTGPVLNRVFQKAFQAAKHVRTHTAIAGGQVSIANVAVELAYTIFGALEETRILLLGAGDIGEKTAKAFQSRGARSVTVASRRLERAMELATGLKASAMPFEQREDRLAEFDVVVCATSAPGTVVAHDAARAAMGKRPARPLFFIDLALPRDVEPAVAKLENVFLYNLDDLAKIAEENRAARAVETAKCRAILAGRAEAVWQHIAPRLDGHADRADSPAASPPAGSSAAG